MNETTNEPILAGPDVERRVTPDGPCRGLPCRKLLLTVVCVLLGQLAAAADDLADRELWINPDGISGALVVCGGGTLPDAIRQRFIELGGGDRCRLVIVPTASSRAETAAASDWIEPWQVLRPESVVVLHTRDRQQADSDEFVKPLRDATAVWFSGGSQSRIADAYLGTAVERELQGVLERGGVVGGTSAGAAIMSRTMIASGNPVPLITSGLGLLPGIIVDQHFSERKRQPRLLKAVNDAPQLAGLGIDEGTAVLVAGRRLQVLGNGQVTVQLAKSPLHEAESWQLASGQVADLTAIRRAARDRQLHQSFPGGMPIEPQVPHGSLIIVGGGGLPGRIVDEFVRLAGGPQARIVVLPTAVEDEQARRQGVPSFLRGRQLEDVRVLPQRSRVEVESPEFLQAIEQATGIWFGGGRQWRFVDAYAHTRAVAAFRGVLQRGGVIAGSSAGASIQAGYLARGNPLGNRDIMARGYERGLGFLPGVAVDQHFTQRGRHQDLLQLVQSYPRVLGIGIDEATALIVRGRQAEVLGRHQVYFLDSQRGQDMIRLEPGSRFDLVDRSVIYAATPPPLLPEAADVERPSGRD